MNPFSETLISREGKPAASLATGNEAAPGGASAQLDALTGLAESGGAKQNASIFAGPEPGDKY
jgi:hypothetical protein